VFYTLYTVFEILIGNIMPNTSNNQSDTNGSSHSMRAAVWKGKPYHVSIDNVLKPELLSSEDAIVRLTSSAICGTDLHIYRGISGSTNPPWVLGHEGVGIVESVGEAVQNIKPGDRVIVPASPVLDIDQLSPPLETFGLGADFGTNDGMQGIRCPCTICTDTALTTSSRVYQNRAGGHDTHPNPTLPIKRA
jgi:NADPH:quinone reductase-like Zn-dependent oxidoreductase